MIAQTAEQKAPSYRKTSLVKNRKVTIQTKGITKADALRMLQMVSRGNVGWAQIRNEVNTVLSHATAKDQMNMLQIRPNDQNPTDKEIKSIEKVINKYLGEIGMTHQLVWTQSDKFILGPQAEIEAVVGPLRRRKTKA